MSDEEVSSGVLNGSTAKVAGVSIPVIAGLMVLQTLGIQLPSQGQQAPAIPTAAAAEFKRTAEAVGSALEKLEAVPAALLKLAVALQSIDGLEESFNDQARLLERLISVLEERERVRDERTRGP